MTRYQPEPDPFPSLRPARLTVVGAGRSDRGIERSDNQDRAAIGETSGGRAWEPPFAVALPVAPSTFYALVCDGMGGEAGGALASGIAVETIVGTMRACFLQRNAGPAAVEEAEVVRALVTSLEMASARIKQTARDEPIYARMGTTATLATIAEGALVCAQIGDSRAYVLREGRLFQVTEDQTMAELLRKSGTLDDDQIRSVVGPNVILQALGSSTRLEVAVTRTPLAYGDVVLLCSDGLYGVLDDREIAAVLVGTPELADACDTLVARANAAGGPDNISCVVFRVVDESFAKDDAEPATTALTPPLAPLRHR